MWQIIPQKFKVMVIVTLTLCISSAYTGLQGWWDEGSTPSLLQTISVATLLISTGAVLLANSCWRWLWEKCPKLESWIYPDLNGMWEGTLVSNWTNPETGKGVAPIPTTIRITQSLLGFHLHLKTGESHSHSTRCFLENDRDAGKARIWYWYQNKPKVELAYRSLKHDGAAWLEFDLHSKERRLQGQYFTERKTGGDIDIQFIRD